MFGMYSKFIWIILLTFVQNGTSKHIFFKNSVNTSIKYLDGDAPNSSLCRNKLNNVNTSYHKCLVVKTFIGCQFDSGFINYLKFSYCYFDRKIVPTILLVSKLK